MPAAPEVTASDNCDDDLTLDYSEVSTVEEGCGTITRTWSVEDHCGNATTAIQVIEVIDEEAPVLTGVPENAEVACTNIPEIPVVTASDNCDPTLEVVFTEIDDVVEGCGMITRMWSVTDNCGNETTATQIIDVYDLEAPVLTGVPADTTVACDAIPEPADVTAEDNCDPTLEIQFGERSSVEKGWRHY